MDLKDAQKLVKSAESMLEEKGWFVFKSSPKYQEASDLFVKAGNIYKTSKDFNGAGTCFLRAAECDNLSGEPDEGARKLVIAAGCFKKTDPAQAVEILQKAVGLFLRAGRFHVAATHEKEIAEIYETQLEDLENALVFYERAAERYSGEDSLATAQKYHLKTAELSAITGNYSKAIEIYEETARASASNPMLKYSVKEYLLRAGISHLCNNDIVGARKAIETYSQIDHSFLGTRESKLLTVHHLIERHI